jgi:hypothetical protein
VVPQQRYAIFNLLVALAALTLFAGLIPVIGPARAQAGFAVLSLSALGPLFFRRRTGEVISDERDRSIFLRATQLSFLVFWLLLVGGLMAAWFLLRGKSAISVDALPLIVWLGAVALFVCQSTCILILYRRS